MRVEIDKVVAVLICAYYESIEDKTRLSDYLHYLLTLLHGQQVMFRGSDE